MNTSIVIPLGRGSRHNDLELRYFLRSIETYLKGYGDIFIIGEKPTWLQNIIHIPYDEGFAPQSHEKERNIFNKIMAACNDERVTDNFLFMNDDHYLREEYEADKFPYYYDGRLCEKMTVTDYKYTVINTITVANPNAYYFDIHCPILYNKQAFLTLKRYNWTVQFGYCIKTLYSYEHVVGGNSRPAKDLKLDDVQKCIDGRSWFSIGDKAFYWDVRALLQELYPNKSKYEL